jgi:hypothetical protein
MTQELDRLIERVERATEGSRELDMLIENALGLAQFERDPHVGYGDADYNRVDPKPLTTSLEAAMTLAPDGWRVRLEYGDNYACASFVKGYGSRRSIWGDCTSERPDNEIALALVAACLRAHKGNHHG